MAAPFEKLVGAAGDIRELEYISALHQTDTGEVRIDASIRAEDIRLFLSSRYGIKVTNETVRNTILSGLGGGSDEDDVLDLMELVAILFIPIFLKAADIDTADPQTKAITASDTDATDDAATTPTRKRVSEPNANTVIFYEQPNSSSPPEAPLSPPSSNPPRVESSNEKAARVLPEGVVPTPPGLLQFVLQMILDDVTGDKSPKMLTVDLIRRILVAYGEYELASDNTLLEEMLQAATGKAGSSQSTSRFCDSQSQGEPMLDIHAFAEGLTHDIRLYDLRNEVRMTTNFDDVFFTDEDIEARENEMFLTATTNAQLLKAHRENLEARQKLAVSQDVNRVNTIPWIDFTAGTYRSKALTILLWATILITYFAYFVSFDTRVGETCRSEGFLYEYDSPWADNQDAMICEAFVSIFNWLIFFFGMSVFGVVCITLGNFGNAIDNKDPWKPLAACLFCFLLVCIPYITSRNDRIENQILYGTSLVLGLITCSFHLSQAMSLLLTQNTLDDIRSWCPSNIHGCVRNAVHAELNVKKSMSRKLSLMTSNALEIVRTKDRDSILNTHFGQALKTYEASRKVEPAGGFFWAWARIFGGQQVFSRDGIWLPARMIAANIALYVIAIYVLGMGIVLTVYIGEKYDKEWAKRKLADLISRTLDTTPDNQVAESVVANVSSLVNDYLVSNEANGADYGCDNFNGNEFLETYCSVVGDEQYTCDVAGNVNAICPLLDESVSSQLTTAGQRALLDSSGFNEAGLRDIANMALQEAADQGIDTLYPSEKYMIVVPMYVATFIAFSTALFLAAIYIPSVASTILKLRCGAIPTLRNNDFNRYRAAPDQVAMLSGSLFWGALFSSLLVGLLIGLVLFFFLWQATVYYAQRLVAIVVGILSVALVRLAIVCTCRCTLYKSFYRERPRAANISILALEWGTFALSAGFILARAVKLLLVTMTYIGRIDTPFLAPNVGRIGPIELDNYPTVHIKDVLSHEAHRHPYIEQLGVIYLMKLRYAAHFGQRAGTCWRLIFVYALMPWLHKYRILARPEQTTIDDFNDLEVQYPSLNFVSLRNVFATEDDLERSSHQNKTLQRRRQSSKAAGTHELSPLPEENPEEADEKKKRITELEAEVERLRECLSAMTDIPAVATA